jgi:hypothetical protein
MLTMPNVVKWHSSVSDKTKDTLLRFVAIFFEPLQVNIKTDWAATEISS